MDGMPAGGSAARGKSERPSPCAKEDRPEVRALDIRRRLVPHAATGGGVGSEDVGLTAEQIGKIRDWVKVSFEQGREFWAKSREILPPSQHFTPDEYEARRREFRLAADAERKGKEMRTKLLAMLTPSQSARLEQIQLQRSLAATLARPEIIKALDISREQSGKIRALRERTGEKWSAESPDLRGLSRKERRQKMIEFMGIPGFG